MMTEGARLARVCELLREHRGGTWSVRAHRRSPDAERWIAVLQSEGQPDVVAKFAPPRAQAVHVMRHLHARHAALRFLRVPEVILEDARASAVVQSCAEGAPLAGVPDSATLRDALTSAGRALAEVHITDVDGVPARTFSENVADIVRPAPHVVMEALPETRDAFARAWKAFERIAPACDAVRPRLAHRDFQPRQLFADGARTWVVDWDDVAYTDPAFDLAYLATYLRTHDAAGDADAHVDAVQRGYAEVAGHDAVHDMRERLAVYECFNYVRRTCRRFRLRDAGWREECARMVRALEDALTAV